MNVGRSDAETNISSGDWERRRCPTAAAAASIELIRSAVYGVGCCALVLSASTLRSLNSNSYSSAGEARRIRGLFRCRGVTLTFRYLLMTSVASVVFASPFIYLPQFSLLDCRFLPACPPRPACQVHREPLFPRSPPQRNQIHHRRVDTLEVAFSSSVHT
jgi:hypothetical protein